MQLIKSPSVEEPLPGNKKLFLAGGLFSCPNWQEIATNILSEMGGPLTVYDPRRENFSPECHGEQIDWETWRLNESDLVLFWFCKETLCPITLYEFGWLLNVDKNIIVGCEPGYQRAYDVSHRLSKRGLECGQDLTQLVISAHNLLFPSTCMTP